MNSNEVLLNNENMEILHQISQLLNTGLDRESLERCVALISGGADPISLSAVLKTIMDTQSED